MTEHDRLAVEEAIDHVVGVADQIHRVGYHELEKRADSDPGVIS